MNRIKNLKATSARQFQRSRSKQLQVREKRGRSGSLLFSSIDYMETGTASATVNETPSIDIFKFMSSLPNSPIKYHPKMAKILRPDTSLILF